MPLPRNDTGADFDRSTDETRRRCYTLDYTTTTIRSVGFSASTKSDIQLTTSAAGSVLI